jgi:hypothetical protein
MLSITLYATFQESDGDWRSFEIIRLHARLFLAVSLVPLLGPLTAYLLRRSPSKKGLMDPLDEPI